MIYNRKTIQEERKSLRNRKVLITNMILYSIFKVLLIVLILCGSLAGGFLYGSLRGIIVSTPTDYTIRPKYSATIIYDDEGHEVQYLSDYISNRIPVRSELIPDNLKNAFISIEDERFYEHNGVDFRGIARAIFNAITNSSSRQGASTITQQLIKNNVFDVGGETNFIARLVRKIQEQVLALKTEQELNKEQILTNYLNTINLGKGTLGVQSAAKYYFNKPVDKLTLSECSTLAGITKNPSLLNPIDHPQENNQRREIVLKKMYDLKYISREDYVAALEDDVYSRISSTNTQQTEDSVYSYFTDAVITQIVEDLQSRLGYNQAQAYNMVYRGGLRIYSTQSTGLQGIADSIINDKENYPVDTDYSLEYEMKVVHADGSEDVYTDKDVKEYFTNEKKKAGYNTIYPSRKKMKKAAASFHEFIVKEGDTVEYENINYTLQPQLSFSLIDQATGHIKVLVGGRGEKTDDLALNRATDFERQPGSTFKILSTYAPALDTGGMTLATVFDDAPYEYENGKKIHNFEKDQYKGLTTIRDAIKDSNNIIAVKAITEITPQVGYDFLLKLGFTTLVQDRVGKNGSLESDVTQALSLGGITDGVDNVELTGAYAAIANKGIYHQPVLYTRIEDEDGNVILSNEVQDQPVMKETTAWLLTSAMKDVVAKGTGKEAKLSSEMGVAGKTGTTSNNYDYWFCGYTPYYTASIWTGYDYNTSFENDADYHKRIWAKIMDRIIEERQLKIKDFDACPDIEEATICIKSGKLPQEDVCSNDPEKSMERSEYFAPDTVPDEFCDNHISVKVCSKSHEAAGDYCPEDKCHTSVFRVRPKGSKGETEDSPYSVSSGFTKHKCSYHTKKWYEEKKRQEELKKEEEERLKQEEELLRQEQELEQNGGNPEDPYDPILAPPLE